MFHRVYSKQECLCFNYSDLLFDQLYARLVENVVAKGVFLEALESYIVMDRLGHLSTPVMKDLLAHYHSNGLMDNLERCIVRLDVTSLDIQQVCRCVSLCTVENDYKNTSKQNNSYFSPPIIFNVCLYVFDSR